MSAKQIALGALFHPPGRAGAWLRPDTVPSDETNIAHYAEMAQLCEQGMFDIFFIADSPATRTDFLDMWSRSPLFQNGLEPVTLLAAIAGATRHIGLGGTVSSSFFEPFNIARQFASLDHISGGRAAWNVVTSANDYAARNFGHDALPPHGERYEKAREVVSIVKSYWDTWEDDAFLYDKKSGLYFDPTKYHVTEFKGKHFKVFGGLNVARSPQGHPVIIQAGASEAGKELAAETAEVVFGTGSGLKAAKAFYDDVKGRMAKFGRNPDEMKILSGLGVIVAETEEEAKALQKELQDIVPIESRLMMLNTDLETNLLDLPLDEPVPLDRIPANSNLHKAYFENIAEMIRSGMTLRDVAKAYNRNSTALCGTPAQIADVMENWVAEGASDGFMIGFSHVPGNIRDIVRLLIPELQRRGMVRTEYTGATLRENLGLSRPANRHVAPRPVAAE